MNSIRFGSLVLAPNCIIFRDDRALTNHNASSEVPTSVFVTDELISNPARVKFNADGPTTDSVPVTKYKQPKLTEDFLDVVAQWIIPRQKPGKKVVIKGFNDFLDNLADVQFPQVLALSTAEQYEALKHTVELFIRLRQDMQAFKQSELSVHRNKERREVALYRTGTFLSQA